jgi:hypothetical protein
MFGLNNRQGNHGEDVEEWIPAAYAPAPATCPLHHDLLSFTRLHSVRRAIGCRNITAGSSRLKPQRKERPVSLQDRLDAFRKNFEAGGPPYNAPEWIHEPMHRATAELIASGAAERAAKVGDKAPAFSLKDPVGRYRSLAIIAAVAILYVRFIAATPAPEAGAPPDGAPMALYRTVITRLINRAMTGERVNRPPLTRAGSAG